ncbi:MAG: ATP synthase F1 subunit delta [Elusimicrobia bacterium]|nr:ATP synthase F1 subunit delta [Elusimicrobiota bacterium]
MHDFGLAARYARALLGAAQATGQLDDVWGDLETLGRRFRQEGRLWRILQHPLLSLGQKQVILRSLGDQPLHPLVEKLVLLLIRKKRVTLFPVIVGQVEEGGKTVEGKIRARVKTATPLRSHMQRQLETVLAQIFHCSVLIETTLDPELLAGVVVRVGDQVMDYSLRGQLTRLQRRFSGSDPTGV